MVNAFERLEKTQASLFRKQKDKCERTSSKSKENYRETKESSTKVGKNFLIKP